MWFIIRAAFCIALIYSLTPGAELADEATALPQALAQAAAPAMRNAAHDAVAICTNEPKLCLEAAQLLASARSTNAVASSKADAAQGEHPIADTLTAVDRAAPWRGTKETHGATRARAASRPDG
jgi:prophage DNA circulation protein